MSDDATAVHPTGARSLLWTVAGVALATAVATVSGSPQAAAWTLAAVLAVCAVARAVLPEPGPLAITVRRRWVDVAVQSGLAVLVGVLGTLLPAQ
ncbi:MAG: DUF3017 domain-containing protein [Actinobacteria bacterium]|nr:DUF3017 domain-containing protein [Actinomycetota bacterium]MCG2797114.1 DUF3017 domain-containing protein [Cellulomonas sp.]